jgi:transposase
MHSIEFSDNDLKTIRFERFHHPDPRVARRMEILSLKAAGFRQRDISRAAGVSRSTIGRLLNIYREAGLSGVREFHEQGPTSPLSEHAGSLSGSRRSAITHLLTLRFQRFDQVVLLADTVAR